MSIRVRFTVIIGILSMIASVVLAYASYQFSIRHAMADARKQGAIVFNMMDSSRTYFKKHQWPLVTELVEEDRFYPEIMSGFVMSRGVWEIFEKRFPEYKFKQACLDPLYVPDLADENEARLIAKFEADSSLKESEGLLDRNGEQFYYFAKPIAIGEKCLRCHGNPDEAPKDQIEIYGSETGYNWKLNQIISTSIVYVPVNAALTAARESAMTLFAMGFVGIILLNGVIWLSLSYGVVAPLAKLTKSASRLSLGKNLDEEIKIGNQDEIGELAKAIDDLRDSACKLMQSKAGK